MALNKKRDAELEELILRAAAEIKQLNPHLGETPQPLSDEDCEQIERDDQELERFWNSPEGQRARALSYSAADAIIEDRGE